MAFSLFKIIKGLLISEENSLSPKEIEITPSGTAGTKTTIVSSQTTNKTLTLPDASDTLVGKATTDVLTNKSIDADTNTITNIENADIKAGAAIDATKIADGSVTSTEYQYLGGVTSDIQTQLNSNANGLSDHLSDATDAHDASAISNVPAGNLAATDVQGALNDVVSDVDSRALDSALTTHTGASSGVHGVTGNVVGTTDSQTLTNKTLTAPVISTISNTGTLTLPTSTDTLVGRATTDTLTNKTISGASNTITNVSLTTGVTGTLPIANGGTGQTAQTAAFDALAPSTTKGDIIVHDGTDNIRLPVGTDGNVIVADSTQASGIKYATVTGVKNYVTNDGAESTVNGWVTYADAAASRPVDGTGGSPNVTITRSTSSPLRGVGSFIFSKDAANRQGQGASYDMTIDSADKAKVLNIIMDWTPDSGTFSGGSSSTDSDLIVYLYDITNAVLIEPTPFKLDGAVINTNYKYVSSFQTNSNSTSYRLIVHCATTSASAYDVKFDAVTVTPSVVTTGAYISDEQQYSLTIGASVTPPTKATTTTFDKAYWRRNGGDMEITYHYEHTNNAGAAAGSGLYLFPLPPGYSIDTQRISSSTGGLVCVGAASGFSTAAGNLQGYCSIASATQLYLVLGDETTGPTIVGSASNPITGATIDYVFNAKIPIQGWGTSQVLSSETDTRVVAVKYTSANGQSLPSPTRLNYEVKEIDTHGAVTIGASWLFTAPIAGVYKIFAKMAFNTYSGGTRFPFRLVKNGSVVANFQSFPSTTSIQTNIIESMLDLKAGDTIYVDQDENATGSPTLVNDSTYNSIEIFRLSGPSQIAASETIALKATLSSATHTANNTEQLVGGWNAPAFDTHGGFNATTGNYTCPSPGKYQILATLAFANNSTGNRYFSFRKNAALDSYSQQISATVSSASVGVVINGGTIIQCNAGDTLSIFGFQNSGGNLAYTGTQSTHISIVRVGN